MVLQTFPATHPTTTRVQFVEEKLPDWSRVRTLLRESEEANAWTNRGPLFQRLSRAYHDTFGLSRAHAVTPCANGGVALEALARLQAQLHGRRLRWAGSAFSFRNLGRGYFSDMVFFDCDERGVLDLTEIETADPDGFDGIILTNPMGLLMDFAPFIAFAEKHRKPLLIDNAAHVHTSLPDWPWQAFSLHHTKPYGVGEGGLAITPAEHQDSFYSLLNYGELYGGVENWFTNGKLSDISCAFHLDRLERAEQWIPGYLGQRRRISRLARAAGLRPLLPHTGAPPTTSVPFLAERPVLLERLDACRSLHLAKYYPPIADRPNACRIFEHVVCVPTHPDVGRLSDEDILRDLTICQD